MDMVTGVINEFRCMNKRQAVTQTITLGAHGLCSLSHLGSSYLAIWRTFTATLFDVCRADCYLSPHDLEDLGAADRQ